MLEKAVQWLMNKGGIEQVLGPLLGLTGTEETPLTATSARAILDEYMGRLEGTINEVKEKLDEQRLGQLLSGLSQLRDSTRTSVGRPVLIHALNNFHEIASLPSSGRTGEFENAQLRSLAFFGMAAAHQLLDDRTDMVAEKIVMAVEADLKTAERFLGMEVCMAILRRISPDQFFQLSGSLMNPCVIIKGDTRCDVLFPADCMYLAPPGLLTPKGLLFSAHLWVREERHPIIGSPFYVVGLTRYSAQLLVDMVDVWADAEIHLPREGSKVRQMKKCGKIDVGFGDNVPIYAPLSGTVMIGGGINDMFYNVDNPKWMDCLKVLAQDPYGEGWLFKISPGLFANAERFNREVANLLNVDAYRRALLSTEGTPRTTPGTVSVNSIAYTTKGGRNKDKDLLISIALVDHLGNPVSDATVKIKVRCVGTVVDGAELVNTTATDGTLTFTIENAPSGTYRTYVLGVEGKKVLEFCSNATPNNKFYKSGGL